MGVRVSFIFLWQSGGQGEISSDSFHVFVIKKTFLFSCFLMVGVRDVVSNRREENGAMAVVIKAYQLY